MPSQRDIREINDKILIAEQRAAEQKELIALLEGEGSSTESARELLVIYESSLSLFISRRNLLLRD